MKKLAGRDFEDLLQVRPAYYLICVLNKAQQCAIPVFEGLLGDEYDKCLRILLFELATWHALAKLRLHTETTIVSLEHSTRRLGQAIRRFESEVCSKFVAFALPSEDAPRGRKKKAQGSSIENVPAGKRKAKVKTLNL